MRNALPCPVLLGILAWSAACASELPLRPAPLRDMEEPLALLAPPDDEAARQALAYGVFTGLRVGDSRQTLEDMLSEPTGLSVEAVVENSPADAAGIEAGDLLLEARGPHATALRWPSEWRALELAAEPLVPLELVVDRAGSERVATLTPIARVHPAERAPLERLREEERVGVVLRAASEVEARAADLGPGGGAVVVGLTRESPWRDAGVRFGDLIRAIGSEPVAHPLLVLERIRAAEPGQELELEIVRAGATVRVRAPVSSRAAEWKEISIPILFSYERDADRSTTSVLLGLVHFESTRAAWRLRFLWFLSFSRGDADRLESIGS
jgi:C-terminal processing protease CtpA/Prc